MSEDPNSSQNANTTAFDEACERQQITDEALCLLGKRRRCVVHVEGLSNAPTPTSPLPRYRLLAIFIRAAIYGVANGLVQHMVQRNQALNDMKQLEQVMAMTGEARA